MDVHIDPEVQMGVDYRAKCILGALVTEADFMNSTVSSQKACDHPLPVAARFCPTCGQSTTVKKTVQWTWKKPELFGLSRSERPSSWADALDQELGLDPGHSGKPWPKLITLRMSSEDESKDVVLGFHLGDVNPEYQLKPASVSLADVARYADLTLNVLAQLGVVDRRVMIYTYCYVSC